MARTRNRPTVLGSYIGSGFPCQASTITRLPSPTLMDSSQNFEKKGPVLGQIANASGRWIELQPKHGLPIPIEILG